IEKNEFHAVSNIKGLTPKEIKAELDNVHNTSAPAFATVYNWVNEFKRGHTSTCDAPRSERPIEIATPEIIDKVHDIVLTDRRVKVRELVEVTVISHGTVISILHEQLGMKKLSARWVLRRFNNILKKKRSHLAKKEVLFYQENARIHTCPTLMAKFNEFHYELLKDWTNHWTYYSDGLKKLENRWIKCI
ncbi:GVQW3 protein, partial [Acromyrmex heyeri]